ncbi:hypothetical protein UNDKW_3743 [Undibacterium sp. KW1]|uniref:restriction endonuclease n=1 Tax=Undibacterium sp. KW1 TaxID=2058624 RepID=UPI001331F0EC|nr:restriction endonuclease [Undibacterium sp. KW1]BBB62016.1 hypothetical protein UNDKW_3743 [Undibacterium sp. KW1]
MTGYVYLEYAPPKTWEHFEELFADLFQIMWGDPNLVRHGRAGQAQNGVDIVARQGSLYQVGLQCKRRTGWPVKKITTKEIDDEVTEAKNFKPKLQKFYILTTAPDDAAIQKHVRELNEKHRKEGLFEIVVFGWCELSRRVTLNKVVADKHFGATDGSTQSPLLASFFVKDGKLQLTEEALDIVVSELLLDYQDWPKGHVVVRQLESDELAEEIKRVEVGSLTNSKRKKRIYLRTKLLKLRKKEVRIATALRFFFTTPSVQDWFEVWQDEQATIIRCFVEQQLNEGFSGKHNELDLWPPGDMNQLSDDRIRVWYPPALYESVNELNDARRKKFDRSISMDSIGELPPSLRSQIVLPRALAKIEERLSLDGSSERIPDNWLLLSEWRIAFR